MYSPSIQLGRFLSDRFNHRRRNTEILALIRLPVMKIECLGLSWQLNLIAPYQLSIGLQSSEISVGVDIQSEMTEYIASLTMRCVVLQQH